MDKDSQMISSFSNAVIDLQVKYRASTVADRRLIRPDLEKVLSDFCQYQIKLLKEGTVTSDADLSEMAAIKQEINRAANTQQLLAALGRTVAFIATKV